MDKSTGVNGNIQYCYELGSFKLPISEDLFPCPGSRDGMMENSESFSIQDGTIKFKLMVEPQQTATGRSIISAIDDNGIYYGTSLKQVLFNLVQILFGLYECASTCTLNLKLVN